MHGFSFYMNNSGYNIYGYRSLFHDFSFDKRYILNKIPSVPRTPDIIYTKSLVFSHIIIELIIVQINATHKMEITMFTIVLFNDFLLLVLLLNIIYNPFLNDKL